MLCQMHRRDNDAPFTKKKGAENIGKPNEAMSCDEASNVFFKKTFTLPNLIGIHSSKRKKAVKNNKPICSIGSILSRALFQFAPFKIPNFMLVLRVITAKCVMLRCYV